MPLRTLATVLAAALLGFAALPQAQARILSQWVQLGPDGTIPNSLKLEVTKLTLNAPLEDDAFVLEIPAGVPVQTMK